MENFNRAKTECRRSNICVSSLLILSLVFLSGASGSGLDETRMTCHRNNSKSFWVRNACLDGLVMVDKARVLARTGPLDLNDERVKLVKEECRDLDSNSFGPIKTRIFSALHQKYICFAPNGRVRPVLEKRVDKRGNLCAFYELPAPTDPSWSYINLQSAYNANWYLGFSQPPVTSRRGKVRPFLLPVQMVTTSRPELNRCEFQFSTGRFKLLGLEEEWSGLFQSVQQFLSRTRTPSSLSHQNSDFVTWRNNRQNVSTDFVSVGVVDVGNIVTGVEPQLGLFNDRSRGVLKRRPTTAVAARKRKRRRKKLKKSQIIPL